MCNCDSSSIVLDKAALLHGNLNDVTNAYTKNSLKNLYGIERQPNRRVILSHRWTAFVFPYWDIFASLLVSWCSTVLITL